MSAARRTHLDVLAVTMLVTCCLLWGLQQVLVKATLPEVPPVYQAFLRFAGATILLLLWCGWRGIKLFERDGSLPSGLLAGALFAAEFACIFIGMSYTTASQLTVFLYTAPFWVAILLPLFVKSETLRPMQWLGLAFAFGAVLFTLREGFATDQPGVGWGNLLALAAGMFWGLTTVVIRASTLSRVSAEKLLFYQVAASTLLLLPLSLALGESWSFPTSSFALSSLFLQAAVGAFASYLAWMWLLGTYPATRLTVFVFLTPVFALIFAALWLGEPVTFNLIAALLLVAVGIALVNRRPLAVSA